MTHTVVQPAPAEAPSTPERAPSEEVGTEIPVRELPRRRPESESTGDGPYDLYDLLDVIPPADPDAGYGRYERYEPIDTRPRVRVYGCCLPIALGMLVTFVGAVTLLLNLVIGAR